MRPTFAAVKRGSIIESVSIKRMAAEGRALADFDGKVLFVEDALPGDVADVSVIRNKADFAIARVDRLLSPSPDRKEPFCDHFGVCGGCKWQHATYQKQLQYKEEIVRDAFRRIAKLEPEVLPIIGASRTEHYRNKLDFSFTNAKWLTAEEIKSDKTYNREGVGFHARGSYDKVVDIEQCWLQEDYSNKIRLTAKRTAIDQHLTFYSLRQHEGFLRSIIVRNTSKGQWMVVIVFGDDEQVKREKFLNALVEELPAVVSWHYVINSKVNDSIADLHVEHYRGEKVMTEEVDGLHFRIGPKSFFQTNTAQALVVYNVVKLWAGLSRTEVVLDLFCGVGSIGLFVASECKQVIGIEMIQQAIDDAHQNAQLNEISNARFICADLQRTRLRDTLDLKPELVIVDPPRAGLHKSVVKDLLELAPKRIIYVSCNPATQARDVSSLASMYALARCQPIDMFPHTFHCENIAELCIRDSN